MRLRNGLGRLGFAYLSAAIVAIGSERVFWYWAADPIVHWEVALVYAFPVAAVLWAIDRFGVDGLWSLLLAVPIFGYVVEGVITPILYSGGPFVPFFPLWFTFWHGFISVVGLWYLLRIWLIDGQVGRAAAAATGFGLFWGMWATTMWLPENLEDPELVADMGTLEILDRTEFGVYTVSFTAILAAAHWLWGRVIKPVGFAPSRWAKRIYVALIAAAVIAWTVVIPWALPMFVVYVGLQIWVLRRHERSAEGPSLIRRLAAPIPHRRFAALLPIPLMATSTYAFAWWLEPPMALIRGFMYTVIFVQTAIALWLMVVAFRRAIRAGRGGPHGADQKPLQVQPLKKTPTRSDASTPPTFTVATITPG